MRSSTDRRSFLKGLGGGTVVGLTGVGTANSDQTPSQQAPEEGSSHEDGELNLISGNISSLDPITATDSASIEIVGQVYETLTHYPNAVTSMEFQLLEDMEVSDDLRTYTFSIREGVQYHDNPIKSELTAHDFRYAWRRLAESSESQRENFLLQSRFLGIEYEEDETDGVGRFNVVPGSIEATVVDDYTLEVTLQEPNPSALDILMYPAFAAMPEGLVGDIEGYDGEYSQDEIAADVMVGTGPFEFESWESDSEVRMTAFDDYWGQGPYVESVHWAIIENNREIWTYGVEKNADIIEIPTGNYRPGNVNADTDDIGREVGTYDLSEENGEILDYTGVVELITFYFGFNAKEVPRPVRVAIAHLIDHESSIEESFKRRAAEAFSFLPPGCWPYGYDDYKAFADSFPYGRNEVDAESARSVLSEAGYTADNPFELTLSRYQSGVFERFGTALKENIEDNDDDIDVPIEFEVEELPFGTILEQGASGDLEMYTLGWIWGWDDPPYGLSGFEPEKTNTNQPGGADGYYLNWQAEDSDASDTAQNAWETVEANPGPGEEDTRNDAYVSIEQARREDMILLPLWHNYEETFRYSWVDGPRPGSVGGHRRQYNTLSLSEDEGPPALPGQENPPQDLDGDGLYEDIDGDGEFTISDVQVFFQNRDSDVVQNNPTAFNFDGSDPADVTIGDVQALFQLFAD